MSNAYFWNRVAQYHDRSIYDLRFPIDAHAGFFLDVSSIEDELEGQQAAETRPSIPMPTNGLVYRDVTHFQLQASLEWRTRRIYPRHYHRTSDSECHT